MARGDRRHPESAAGDWYVDDRCIGCGGAVSIAPELFTLASDGRRFVMTRQPATVDEVLQAQLAAEVCPSRSIGTASGARWPRHHPLEIAPGVWRTGSISLMAAGGNAFVVRFAAGNVIIASPRFTSALEAWIGSLGGLTAILLTQRDEADYANRCAEAFGAQVAVHAA